MGVPAGLRAGGGGRSGARSAELLDTWSGGPVPPSSLGLRKGAWPSPKWEESRTRIMPAPVCWQRAWVCVCNEDHSTYDNAASSTEFPGECYNLRV